ncbi:hypothetical protein A0R06_20295 [Salmonella enterica]|nr:hypothetical protein [Salmonella enterica]EBT1278741.1 hypothetical protein [Salmonella enterica]
MNFVLTLIDRLALKAADTFYGGVFYYEFSSGKSGGPRFKPFPKTVNHARNLSVEDLSEGGSELLTLIKPKRLVGFTPVRSNKIIN